MSSLYLEARRDFEELEKIAPLDDWMAIEENLVAFMQNPRVKFAAGLYESAIELWFCEHGIKSGAEEIASRRCIKDRRNDK